MAKRAQKSPAAKGTSGKNTTGRSRAQTTGNSAKPPVPGATSTPSSTSKSAPVKPTAPLKSKSNGKKAAPQTGAPKVSSTGSASAASQTSSPSNGLDDEGLDTNADLGCGSTGTSPSDMGAMLGSGMQRGESENYLEFLARVFQDMSANSWNPQQFDSMTQGMSLVLGSGPAFAALESMMANTTAQSAVLMNAVQTQRQLDQVGLCCTSACVQSLLNMNTNRDSD